MLGGKCDKLFLDNLKTISSFIDIILKEEI